MLPLLILIVPPSVVGGSYLMWYSGQKVVLSRQKLLEPPPQSAASYSAGIATLVGTYGLLGTVLLHQTNATENTKSTIDKQSKQGYVSPKNFADFISRIGRPILLRVGTGSVAFFCAGAAQTYIALKQSDKK